MKVLQDTGTLAAMPPHTATEKVDWLVSSVILNVIPFIPANVKKHKRDRRQSNKINLSETNTYHSMLRIFITTCYLHKLPNKTKRPVPDRKEKHIDFGFSDLTGRPVDHFATFKEDMISHVGSKQRKTTG